MPKKQRAQKKPEPDIYTFRINCGDAAEAFNTEASASGAFKSINQKPVQGGTQFKVKMGTDKDAGRKILIRHIPAEAFERATTSRAGRTIECVIEM